MVTVFAGQPPPSRRLTTWDSRCGFRAGQDVVKARRQEDLTALGMLRAVPLWLEFPESQYRLAEVEIEIESLCRELRDSIDATDPAVVAFPIGLAHPDHLLVHDVTMMLARTDPARRWIIYADLPYAVDDRFGVAVRLDDLAEGGTAVHRVRLRRGSRLAKGRAARRYPSQLRGIGPGALRRILRRERYWEVGLPGTTRC